MFNNWKQEFDWVSGLDSTGNTYYYQQDRQNYDISFAEDSLYENFRYNKCLSGTCWSYVDSLEDIYKLDIYTGDGIGICNYYTEFDSIEEFMYNLYPVDLIIDENTDTGQSFYQLDNTILRPEYRILFTNQINENENLVYKLNNIYKLEPDELLTENDSFRYKLYCKSGTYKDKQFSLSGGTAFPIYGEDSTYFESESFLLRHIINYDIMLTGQTSSDCAKFVFVDYDLARKQLTENSSLYDSLTISIITGNTNYITYGDESYVIENSGYSSIDYNYVTGYTNTTTSTSTANIYNESGVTYIKVSANFIKDDNYYINLIVDGTYLNYKGFIDSTLSSGDLIALVETIPDYVLYNCINSTSITYSIENLQITNDDSTLSIVNAINVSPFNRFLTSYYINTNTMLLSAKTYEYFKYFDYDSLEFETDSTFNFSTDNNYINYKLQPFLYRINTIFDSSYTLYNNFTLSAFTIDTSLSGYYKIIPDNILEMENFREFTYLKLSGTSSSSNSLLLEKHDDYLLIESGTTPLLISNIDNLLTISDLLYNNYNSDLQNNIYKNVSGSYGQILSEDTTITDNITGIVYRDNNRFVCKIYDKDDINLSYNVSELVGIGTDKKTKFPLFLFDDDFESEI